MRLKLSSCVVVILIASGCIAAAPSDIPIDFVAGNGRVTVVFDGLPVAVYHYQDEAITRPFFAHVRVPAGMQVTRHHPPINSQDLTDHATFHPGIWMSFGDISGSDFWRIKARVKQAEFVQQPKGGAGKGSFAVRNDYFDEKDPAKIVCHEVAEYTFLSRPAGYLLLWKSTFSNDKEFSFGDQEEMGLGFRVATPLRVGASGQGALPAGNGRILDSEGRENEKQIWGNSAKWCDYSGVLAGNRVGMAILCHPDNLRPSWFHARDYGLLVANEFGRKAFSKGEPSKIVVRPGEKFVLRYGVLLHSGPIDNQPDMASAYNDYLQIVGQN